MQAYRTIKLNERRYLIARESFNGVLVTVAECRNEHTALDLAYALNNSPQPEAVATIHMAHRNNLREATAKVGA